MTRIFLHFDREGGVKETICLDDIVRVYASPETLETHEEAYIQFRHSGVRVISYTDAVKLIQAIQVLR